MDITDVYDRRMGEMSEVQDRNEKSENGGEKTVRAEDNWKRI